jgi:RHS repeat-associated protein
MKSFIQKMGLIIVLLVCSCFFLSSVHAETIIDDETENTWLQYFPSSKPSDVGHRYFDQPDLFSGSSSYTYQFKLPPGTAGMVPNLKLVYSSDNENGLLGMGWELDGFAYVESRPVYPYGYILKINGSVYELVAASNNSSGKGEYHTKRESWMKIYYNGSAWTVKTKNGTEYKIGATAKVPVVGRSTIRKWMVDEVLDNCSNIITYSYTTDAYNGECYPESIVYTKNSKVALTKVKTVKFIRESRSDNVMPEGRWMSYRISGIQVLIDGELVDKYVFSYSYSKCSYRSLLNSISRYGKGNNPEITTFDYAASSGSISWSSNGYNLPTVNIAANQLRQFGDINGDGLTDCMIAQYSSSELRYVIRQCCYNRGDGCFSVTNFTDYYTPPVELDKSTTEQPRFVEINGDGYVDIVTYRGRKAPYINTHGNSWTKSEAWQETMTSARRYDLNNDGVIDYFDENSTYLSSPSSNGWVKSGSYNIPDQNVFIADFNGDDYPDLLYNSSIYINNRSSGWSIDSQWAPPNSWVNSVTCKDLNGDGLVDISYGGDSQVYINTARGWSADSRWKYISTSAWDTIDLNGDGLFDFVSGLTAKMRKPNGDIGDTLSLPERRRFLYINDDPYPDIYDLETGAVYISKATPDLLTKVTLPTGGSIGWSYKRVAVDSYLSSGWRRGATFRKYVVDKITTNEGTSRSGSTFTTSFEYPVGRYERSAKLFVGFSYVKKVHPNGEYSITRFNQDIKSAGTICSEENYASNGALKYKQTNNWVTGTVSSSPGYKVLLGSQTTEWPGSGTNASKSEVSYTYDEYGNAITELQMGEVSKTGDEVTYERSYINDTSNWLIGFPSREKTVDQDGNVLADKLIWYDGLSWGAISKGLVSEEKFWLDNFCGTTCSDDSFYYSNSSMPNSDSNNPHPIVKYTYDAVGNRSTTTKHNVWQGGNGDQTETVEYDSYAFCLPVKYTNALGQTTTFTVDYVVGKPLTITDSNQGIKKYVYDSLGRITSEFGPRDAVNPRVKCNYANALTRTPKNQYITIERQTDIGSTNYIWERSFLDGFGRVWNSEKQAPENKETEHKLIYDWNGLMAEDDLPWFKSAAASVNVKSIYIVVNPKTIVYDSLQRVLSVKEPDGNVTQYAYDGLKTTIIDPNNNVTRQFQDAYGRLVRIEQDNDDGTYVTINEYDALGRLIRVLDANYNAGVSSKSIDYQYDSLGRMIYSSDPYSGGTGYHYDLIGNLISKTDAKGNKLIYEYDSLNRMAKKSVLAPDGTVPTVLSRNVYDEPTSANGAGRLTSTLIGNDTLDGKYDYDLEGNIISSNKSIDGSIYTTNITYDSLNRIKQLTYPDKEMVGYEYDTGALSQVTGFVKYSDWISAGIPGDMTYANGVATHCDYHPGTLRLLYLITKAPDDTYIQSFKYEYDKAGNITVITDNEPVTTMHTVSTTQNFEYDKINRLKKSGFGIYSYDRAGNITTKEQVTFGYNDSNHPYCPTIGSNGYKAAYDSNGNLIGKTDKNGVYWRYQYNAENMLIAVYQGPEKGKEYLVEEYFYDAAGMRSQKNTYDGATVKTTRYIYFGNNVIYETGPGTTRYILAGGREIAKVVDGKTYYTHRDHLGSSSVVTDSAGAVVNWNANHPYGENWQVSPVGTVDLDKHRFTGKETDASSGLVYFGARFYDPEVGRFITVDPGKDGLNWYAYCDNNPLRYIDPDGRVLVDLSLESIKATGKWILNNAGALVEIGSGALLTVLGYGADAATGAAVLATDGAAIVAVPGEQALSAGAKAAGMVMMARGAGRLNASSSGGSSDLGGLRKGKPDVPEGSTKIRKDSANVKSNEFKDFIRDQGKNFKSNEWKYQMETWKTEDGITVERHYWQNTKTGECYYHL